MPAQAQGSVQSNIRGWNYKGSLRVFVVSEKVVEDSEGGLQVQVDNIWKTAEISRI